MRFLQMLHEDSNDDVDKHKLRHEHKDDKEDRRDDSRHAAVLDAVSGRVAVLTQRILHDTVPVVTGRHPKEGKESDSKVCKMGVFS